MISTYFHIPFCMSKCAYCDFYSLGGSKTVPEKYILALLREIKRHDVKSSKTIYFGGGTPSLLSPSQTARLIDACRPQSGAEITIEANPDTINYELLKGYKAAGVNRISLGVQTQNPESLARLGRRHSAETTCRALDDIVNAGFENISGDIMLALPYYTNNEFDETLAVLKSAGAAHISAYILKIEQETAFGRRPPKGLCGDDKAADFYFYAVKRLESEGYMQYEISNFAKKGYEGRHNLAYWNCDDYIGIGAAAHSCVGSSRFYYKPDINGFITQAEIIPDGGCDENDYIMLRLRLNEGLDLSALKTRFNFELSDKQFAFLKKCEQNGFAEIAANSVRLTLGGMLVQNSILTQLL